MVRDADKELIAASLAAICNSSAVARFCSAVIRVSSAVARFCNKVIAEFAPDTEPCSAVIAVCAFVIAVAVVAPLIVSPARPRPLESTMFADPFSDIDAYFGRYRSRLHSRNDIATVSGLSAADVAHIQALYTGK